MKKKKEEMFLSILIMAAVFASGIIIGAILQLSHDTPLMQADVICHTEESIEESIERIDLDEVCNWECNTTMVCLIKQSVYECENELK